MSTVPFWGADPNVLFTKSEFFPVSTMTYEEKMNSITRGVIVLGLVSFALTMSIRILAVTIITVLAIYGIHFYGEREGFDAATFDSSTVDPSTTPTPTYTKLNAVQAPISSAIAMSPADVVLKERNISKDGVFSDPNSSNPFGNFMVSDYKTNPYKKPAPAAFNNNKILEEAKALVAELNPGQPDISDKLFKDLGEQYVFEQSLRQFTSNPSTTLMNDQTGFADFCYGSMTSCKEGNLFACARNLPRHVQ